jgi:hypothetical protein
MYDIAFISYNEPLATSKYIDLLTQFPYRRIIRVNNVKGIREAHIEAAKQVATRMFYVVDADAKILPSFKFDLKLTPAEEDIVHVWRSVNPVNGLEYGYGAVKLLPTQMTLDMDFTNPDMTTSISKRFKIIPEVSNVTQFNTDPLSTWRSAFRECVKLASRSIEGQRSTETEKRLDAWLYEGGEEPFGEYSKAGASAGKWYGTTYKDDLKALSKINDYAWLEQQFKEHTKLHDPNFFKTLTKEQAVPSAITEDNRVNWWRDSFREAATTTDSDRLNELLFRGINEYTRSGASAGKWWGETYRKDIDKMNQILDDEFLKGEFYWHTENNPVEQFQFMATEEDKINWWRDSFREAATTTDPDRLHELTHAGTNEYTRSGASAGKWWGETYQNDSEKMNQILDDEFLKGNFYWHIEQYPVENFK